MGIQSEGSEMSVSGLDWMLASDEPWTRYRVRVDLEGRPAEDPEVRSARETMLADPRVQALVAQAAVWPGTALARHNNAGHTLHLFSVLVDFGVRADDPGMPAVVEALLAHQAPEGAFQTLVRLPGYFMGLKEDPEGWLWMICDAPVVLHALLGFGLGEEPRVQAAVAHLTGLAAENGWPCIVTQDWKRFHGPGRKEDPCPIATVYALRALSLIPGLQESPAVCAGIEMLLGHWERRSELKPYLFAMGSDFCKVKYPFVWYDLLHVLDVLSRFPRVHHDPRFREMLTALEDQADAAGRYTARSMYKAWQGWSFADKKHPSPWLTLLAQRIRQRVKPQEG